MKTEMIYGFLGSIFGFLLMLGVVYLVSFIEEMYLK